MAYDPVTVAQFKAAKPQFDAVDNDSVQLYLDLASRFADETWTEKDYPNAVIAMACHLMTLEGLGSDAESELQAQGGSKLTSLKSGTLSLTFGKQDSTGDEFKDWLGQTPCGRFYLTLLSLNKRGPVLLTAGNFQQASGYAKDWPYKFPGIGRG